MTQLSARIELPYLQPSQAQKHVTHNEALQRLDAVVQLTVRGFADETPPGLPVEGDVHALGPYPTGAWAGHGGDLACWEGLSWIFVTPQEGWRAWGIAEQELRVLRAGSWQAQTALQNLTLLGVGTTADATNRLAVASDAVLLSHDGAGHQVKINKAGAGDTASLLFQSDWTGHAELGLTGDTALSFKVSADGLTWNTALKADPLAGQISLAPGAADRFVLSDSALALDVPLTGSAVQSGCLDDTAGRLSAFGAFGLGGKDLAQVSLDDGLQDLGSGFYAGGGATADGVTFPDATAAYRPFLNATRRLGPGDYRQTRLFFGDALRVCEKPGLAAAWQETHTLVSRQTLLGSVTQTAGVPTGAVIERGSNANGDYVRYADGTQMCWLTTAVLTTNDRNLGSIWASAAATLTFPAAFSAVPVVSVTALRETGDAFHWAGQDSAAYTTTTCSAYLMAGSNTSTGKLQILAVGRWF